MAHIHRMVSEFEMLPWLISDEYYAIQYLCVHARGLASRVLHIRMLVSQVWRVR